MIPIDPHYGPGVVVTVEVGATDPVCFYGVSVDGVRAGSIASDGSGKQLSVVASGVREPIFLGFHSTLRTAVDALVQVSRAVHR